MFNTQQCERIGVFEIKEACRSIDISKDSKLLIASATTIGFHVFRVSDGTLLKTVAVPGLQTKQVLLSYSDKEIIVLYDDNKRSYIRIYEMKSVMAEKADRDVKCVQEIAGSTDFTFTHVVWGALDKCIYVSTTIGKVFCYDVQSGREMY